MGKSKSVIHSILRKLEENGSCEVKKPTSRPRKTTAREYRWIGNEKKKVRIVTATTISERANASLGIKISRHIFPKINEIYLNSRFSSTKPYISEKNKMSQLKFATEYVMWTEEQLDCVHFSDESKFNLFGCGGRRLIRRSPKELYSPHFTKSNVKFGGRGMMVFGTISAAGTGPLVRLHGQIKAHVFKKILKKFENFN